jgi:hypothetical protein
VLPYEQHRPSGLLKRNWCHKHRTGAPAVAVLMFEWKEAQDWPSQEFAILTAANKFKLSNVTHLEMRLMIVVVRHSNVPNGMLFFFASFLRPRTLFSVHCTGITCAFAYLICCVTSDLPDDAELEERIGGVRRQLSLSPRQAFFIKTVDLKNSLRKYVEDVINKRHACIAPELTIVSALRA